MKFGKKLSGKFSKDERFWKEVYRNLCVYSLNFALHTLRCTETTEKLT